MNNRRALTFVLFGAITPLLASGAVPETSPLPLPSPPAWSVSVNHEESTRPVVEYDDHWANEVDTHGNVHVQRSVAAASLRVTPGFLVEARAGVASVRLQDFHGPRAVSYEFAFAHGPTAGLGIRSPLGRLPWWGLDAGTLIDLNWTRPAAYTAHLAAGPLPFHALVTDWQLGAFISREWQRAGLLAGARWSDFNILYDHESLVTPGARREGGFDATSHGGVFAGVTGRIGPHARVAVFGGTPDANNVELRITYEF